ncbi:TonB-dependent receptor [Bernardetia sp. ABR2-2B]|uniref:TonB-dependent receptor plug domain-containing protein n=1 Tax=Bernardetia sp. ABR2-2B TaxID=3127472 RepID=UPI0030D17EE2
MKNTLLFLLLFVALSLPSFAQIDSLQNELYKFSLDELTEAEETETAISVASNISTDENKQPAAVTTITREQLQLSSARTLAEALTLFVPGFFLVEDQDDMIMGFRGLAPDNNSKVMLLINGHNVNTEFFWGPADAILNNTNYDYIERVEVIRGAGSVTLGQGALLGVINIVTKQGEFGKTEGLARANMTAGFGLDGALNGSFDAQLRSGDLKSYFYISTSRYQGQELRNEGWAAQQGNQGFTGGQVKDIGLRLRKSESVLMTGNIEYKNFTIEATYTDQIRDLYNFYRDRNVFNQTLTSIVGSYNFNLSQHANLKAEVNYAQDNFALFSVIGTAMGGTREDRLGGKLLLNLNELIPNNKLAIGLEARVFQMGKANNQNNNFIANKIGAFDPITANQVLTMGFRKDIQVFSLFAEDYYSVSDKLEVFGAFRYDNHPFWGNNISPRVGAIYSPTEKFITRLSYQTGFRGAVGLHYTGGYNGDGFLRADNYGNVNGADIPVFDSNGNPTSDTETNIPTVLPERVNGIEGSFTFLPSENLKFNAVAFYNSITNVIDVGVIYRNPDNIILDEIGTDKAGDWNGFWYFKNTPGSFNQVGLETSMTYSKDIFDLIVSHSLVKVLGATEEQKQIAQGGNSMYLADGGNDNLHFKAYPESIFRANFMVRPIQKISLGMNALYYGKWYSPIGTVADGGLILNFSSQWNITKTVQWGLSVKNLLNEKNLSPMNSNAGGEDISSGTPAWETTTGWTTIRLNF